jgi:hypothetical protein
VCIVVEYCMRGSLYEVMSEETFNLTWERSLRVLFLILHFILPDEHLLTRFLVLSLLCSGPRSWPWRSTICTSAFPAGLLARSRNSALFHSLSLIDGVCRSPGSIRRCSIAISRAPTSWYTIKQSHRRMKLAAQSANAQRALLSRQLDNDWTIKVCDFGASRLDTPTETVTLGKMRYIHRIPLSLDAAGSSTH